tara:strand:+ start:41 stop:199 length:159 start_codon:yes stop_codon:yes gene_type:complete
MKIRITAKLDVKPPYVIKPVHFEGLRKIGLSVDLAKKYSFKLFQKKFSKKIN